jgi:predicted phage terminase large subunit-like protein
MADVTKKIIKKIITDKLVRTHLAKRSHFWFFCIYFSHYIKFRTAPFHKEMFALTENNNLEVIVISAFRGSSKSTIMTLSYPLWSILGKQKKKYVLILSQTQNKAQQFLMNIKRELESNELLKRDLGPFEEEKSQWGIQALVINKFDAKISTGSIDQSIRGIRHGPHRPDLIIIDDIEDLESVKTKECRDKIFNWFTGEIIPAKGDNARIVIVGTTLHEDSFLNRIKKIISNGKAKGVYKEYPIIDENGNPLWPGKFDSTEKILEEKNRVMDDIAWNREFLLKIISSEETVILSSWIHYYDHLPSLENSDYKYTWTGVDPAISTEKSADYTGIISAQIHGYQENLKIYILPNIFNVKKKFPEIIELLIEISKMQKTESWKVFIEDNAFQAAIAQQLQYKKITAEGVKSFGDKRSRLCFISQSIIDGTILFPKQGAEELINQLTGFGIEKHDDLSDALVLLASKILEDNKSGPQLFIF